MKSGKSINRPVLARHLELSKRRCDYKIHLRTIREQKCATDFSQPPPIFRFETVLRNDGIKRRERQKYEDRCIEKINEHYANKIINSNSFRDPDLIQKVIQKKDKKKLSKSSFQMNSTSEKFNQVNGYIIPHYDLPQKFLTMETNNINQIHPPENKPLNSSHRSFKSSNKKIIREKNNQTKK